MQHSGNQDVVPEPQQDTMLSRAHNDLSLLKARKELMDKENAQLVAAAVETVKKLRAHDPKRLKVLIDHQVKGREHESVRIDFLEGLVNIDDIGSLDDKDTSAQMSLEHARKAVSKVEEELKVLFRTGCAETNEVHSILATAIDNFSREVSVLEEITSNDQAAERELLEVARERDAALKEEEEEEPALARRAEEIEAEMDKVARKREEMRQHYAKRLAAVRQQKADAKAQKAAKKGQAADLNAAVERCRQMDEKWGVLTGVVSQDVDSSGLLQFKLMVRAHIPEGHTWEEGVPYTTQQYQLSIQLGASPLQLPVSAHITPEVPAVDLQPLLEEVQQVPNAVPFLVSGVYKLLVEHRARQLALDEISTRYPILPISSKDGTVRAVLPNGMEAELKLPSTWPTKGTVRLLTVQAPMSQVAGLEQAVAVVQGRYPGGANNLWGLLDEVAEAVNGL